MAFSVHAARRTCKAFAASVTAGTSRAARLPTLDAKFDGGSCTFRAGHPLSRLSLRFLCTEKVDDAEGKSAVKSKINEALEEGNEQAASHHLREFLNLKSINLNDCNEILQTCWIKENFKVAKHLWQYMDSRDMEPNAYSIACWLGVLSRSGYLDEALDLLYHLGRTIKNVQPHIIYCGIYLNGCSLIGSAAYAEKCLQFIKDMNLEEDELVYLELMKLGGKRKDLPAIQKAWSYIVNMCKPSVPTLDSYCAAVTAFCNTRDAFNEAIVALTEMVKLIAKHECTLICQKKMRIMFFTKGGIGGDSGAPKKERHSDERLALEEITGWNSGASTNSILSHAERQKTSENDALDAEELEVDAGSSLYGRLLKWTRLAMLRMEQAQSSNLPESLQSGGSSGSALFCGKVDSVRFLVRQSFSTIINAAVNRKDLASAELLFSQVQTVGITPDIYTFNALLRAVVRGRGLEHGFQVIQTMERKGVKPDTFSYNAILEGFCAIMELEKAEALLERMLQSNGSLRPSIVSFNTLLKACGDADELKRALRIFSKMVNARMKPNGYTILYLLAAFGRINAFYELGTKDSQEELSYRLSAIESYMDFTKLRHNVHTFNALLVALSSEGMTYDVFQRLHLAQGCLDERGVPIINTVVINTVMNAFIRDNQWNAAEDVFSKMSILGLKPNTETYNVLIKGCANRQDTEDAFRFYHTIKEEGLTPTVYTYNSLVKVCCYSDELDAAVEVLKEMDEIKPNTATFVTLLSSACNRERLDLVEYLIEYMHREKIPPNITICEHVVTAYLNCNQVDDAAEALRVLSIRMLPEGGDFEGQLGSVLESIFSEDSLEVESSTIQLLKDVLLSKGMVSEAFFAARMSGFGHTFVGAWNAEESPWAMRLSHQFGGSGLSSAMSGAR